MFSDLNLNIFNLIIFSGVIHGIIFSISVTTKRKYITNNTIYLALVVLFLSLSNFQYWILDTGLINKYPIIKFIYIPWHWLVLPMFYLYVKRFISVNKIDTRTKYILISPFFLVLTIHILQVFYKLFINSYYEIPSHFGRGVFVYIEFFSVVFNFAVMYFTHKMIVVYEKDKNFDFNIVKSETKWLKNLIYLGIVTCIFWLIAITIVVIYDLNKSYVFYPMWIGISVLVYWIGYVGLNKSRLLKERIRIRKNRIETEPKLKIEKQQDKSFKNIEISVIKERLFLNSNIKLKDIALHLDLSEGYISQLINKYSGLNFNDYINTLRIEESKRMLRDKDYNNYTIIAVGLESGFNSKSSFYTAFKKFTGQTPTEFRKSVRNL